MTKEKEILDTYCKFSGMIYNKYQVDAYGIRPTPPNYDEGILSELKMKRDKIKNSTVEYLPEANFIFEQNEMEGTWSVLHNLGYNPKVIVLDNDGKQIEGIILYVTVNLLTITFTLPTCGKVYLY